MNKIILCPVCKEKNCFVSWGGHTYGCRNYCDTVYVEEHDCYKPVKLDDGKEYREIVEPTEKNIEKL